MTITKNNWLFLALGMLIGAAATAGYSFNRWHNEEARLASSRIDANLDLLERFERRDNSARDLLRTDLRTQFNALGARDDLSFYQCTNRRRIFDRVDRIADFSSGNDADALKSAEILGRYRAGAFACERK